jgi:hypothetical protein
MYKTTLVEITFLIRGLAVAIERGNHAGVTLGTIKSGLQTDNIFPSLANTLPAADLSYFTGTSGAEIGGALTAVLRAEDRSFDGRERRKLGIESNGICYLLSLANEAIQGLQWEDPRLTIHPKAPPEHV